MQQLTHPHLFIPDSPDTQDFTSPRSGRDSINFPDRPNRAQHANFVRQALDGAWRKSAENKDKRKAVSLPTRSGTYIEFESSPDFDLKTKSLDQRQSGIRLLNVATKIDEDGKETTFATVFLPEGKEAVLLKKIDQYENENTPSGKPQHLPFISSINNLKEAILESFWRDNVDLIPPSLEWCEVWLRYTDDAHSIVDQFLDTCGKLNIETKEGYLSFPERAVVLIKASESLLKEILLSFDYIAEFRKAKSTADFWMSLDNSDKSDWVNAFSERISVVIENDVSVCMLDTGANNGHTLLAPVLSNQDCHSVNPLWGNSDDDGHGTLMCGIAAYGNEIDRLLQSTHQIDVSYLLESVKLIPSAGHHHEKELYGFQTKQAVSRAEISRPNFNRIICLSITSEDNRDEGRPSSWSGSIDQICSGAEDTTKRLMILAGGNIKESSEWKNYPLSNITQTVHDPGQAWNAITVGAYTCKVDISDNDLATTYSPIAKEGELSPYSTTSRFWDNKWPIKPDIVFEGGNAGIDNTGFSTELDDLSILSTHHKPQESQFSVMNATSAASAQAARMAGLLSSYYPDAWPETIRALMIHSAKWTPALKNQFFDPEKTEKQNLYRLLRSSGYGVPNFNDAIESATNSLTLITEQEIQPFKKKDTGADFETKDMHLIELPWPVEALQDLPGETPVTINITLSYFVEPGPGEIGWRDKYRYRSHGLDFELKGPTEDKEEFLKHLNKAARNDEPFDSNRTSIDWDIGSQTRNKGSIHRDWVHTTAAQAAACNIVGVFPRTGWWKERSHLARGDTLTRYSLIISLQTDSTDVDIYTPIANIIVPKTIIQTS